MKKCIVCLLTLVMLVSMTACTPPWDVPVAEKPVIYLYPEEETGVMVELDYNGTLLCTYPEYADGWSVIASPDGTLYDAATGKEYSYLFWEGVADIKWDMTRGYVVKGSETADFLEETLTKMGLSPRERNDFITYWLPRMANNPYNLITFQEELYTESAVLSITPTPDSLLRVFMVYQPLTKPIEVEAPEIKPFERKGFTVVEWGGAAMLGTLQ